MPRIVVSEPEALSHRCVMQALHTLGWDSEVLDAQAPHGPSYFDAATDLVVLGLQQDMAHNRARLKWALQTYPQAVVMGICPRMASAERCALLDAGLGFVLEKPFFKDECASAIQAVLRRRALGLRSSVSRQGG